MNFDKCIYPCNQDQSQNTEHVYHHVKVLHSPLQLFSTSAQEAIDLIYITTDYFFLYLDFVLWKHIICALV